VSWYRCFFNDRLDSAANQPQPAVGEQDETLFKMAGILCFCCDCGDDIFTVTGTAPLTEFTTFVGFSEIGDISTIVIMPAIGGVVFIDNFAFGTDSVPEPTSVSMLLIGSTLLLFRHRRQRLNTR
jgi:hypothetical protein